MASVLADLSNVLEVDFETIPAMIRMQAHVRPERRALMQGGETRTFAELDRRIDQVAAAFQRDGLAPGQVIGLCAATRIEYVEVFLGALRAGLAVAPLAASARPEVLAAMMADAQPVRMFLDGTTADVMAPICADSGIAALRLDPSDTGLDTWLAGAPDAPQPVSVQPDHPFNIIYSSGTTGTPKGIVQTCLLRWLNVHRAYRNGYGPDTVTLLSTPMYSNTTLATLFGAISLGSTLILMDKFNTAEYLRLCQAEGVTHTVLVPIQYQRVLADPAFADHDLSAFRMKFSTGAPFTQALKAQVLRDWPGGLVEIYGMTEGGGACALEAHKYPHKLHTVGLPMPGNEIRLIDDQGQEVAPGEAGEIVGHSRSMMSGYLNLPEKTAEVEWYDPQGRRFLRTGDIGRFDEDGFLMVLDRKKDMIISGGFNIYSSDLENVLLQHPAVREAAVVAVPSERWGETPVAFVVLVPAAAVQGGEVLAWANERLGKMQRLADVVLVDEIARNPAGKVLKRDLRDRYVRAQA